MIRLVYFVGVLTSISLMILSFLFKDIVGLYSPLLMFFLILLAVIFIYKLFPYEILMLGFQVFSLLFMLFSNVIIENGAYIVEQFKYGYQNGSTLSLGFYVILSILWGCYFLKKQICIKKIFLAEKQIINGYKFLILMGFLIISLYSYLIVSSGILNEGLSNRFVFWTRLENGFFITLAKYFRAIIPALSSIYGFLFFFKGYNKYRNVMVVFFLVIMILLFITGDKATPFISFIFGFILGGAFYLKNNNIKAKISFGKVLLSISLFLSLLLISILGYAVQHNVTLDNLYNVFTTRLALQGHVWFGIYDVILEQNNIPNLELSNLLSRDSLDNPTGLSYLSYIISEYDYVYDRISRGISFTMGGVAAAIGFEALYWRLILYISLFTLYSIVLAYCYKKATSGEWGILLISLIYIVSLNSVILMGNWYSLYNSASVLFYAVIIYDLLRKFKLKTNDC